MTRAVEPATLALFASELYTPVLAVARSASGPSLVSPSSSEVPPPLVAACLQLLFTATHTLKGRAQPFVADTLAVSTQALRSPHSSVRSAALRTIGAVMGRINLAGGSNLASPVRGVSVDEDSLSVELGVISSVRTVLLGVVNLEEDPQVRAFAEELHKLCSALAS
jgi:hypothetical protein